MTKLREEAFAYQNNGVSEVRSNVTVSDEALNEHIYISSSFGPCCTNGCQYCHPNCHEPFDSSNYF